MKSHRYQRQELLPQIGSAGQERLNAARVLIVGCGALGCHLADQLARAGIGRLNLADRDIVELSNLQRQTLFDESDIHSAKAEAAAKRLRQVNSQIQIEPLVTDIWAGNIHELIENVDLILDGTDNVQTRYLLNDAAVEQNIPWIHAACVGMEGRVLPIRPGKTACLRCIFPTPPQAGELPTCDTAGVLQPAAAMTASLQAAQAIKMLIGSEPPENKLWKLDAWSGRFVSIDVSIADDCPCCRQRQFPFLQTSAADSTVSLCGRNAVQIRPTRPWNQMEFDGACLRLEKVGQMESAAFFSRCRLNEPPGFTVTCFRDGRLLIDGTSDPGRARAICARFIGA